MRRVLLAIVSTTAVLVLILSFKTHSASSLATPPAAVSTPTTTPTTSATAATTRAATKTITGDSIDTRFGPVQVRITVTNGKITSATAIDYPTDTPRDQQINAYAIPTLNQEAVGSTTANINMVSGATYTSDGYLQSLQSALDKV
ncbi:MAG TPA: FMN-binding protein [Mycobacteriales bacterium]|nr:FMN-binding protein [Mycobacteriales bacterium]